jgi:Tol biopolymer transport system component
MQSTRLIAAFGLAAAGLTVSAPAPAAVEAAPSGLALTATTTRVSVASDGAEGNDHSSNSAISADARYVAFLSSASNLVPADTNGDLDVFVRDQVTGVTERVSVGPAGAQANSWSEEAAMSADGRYVAFVSMASNLVPGDTNGFRDVFVRDLVAQTTRRVSVSAGAAQANGASFQPSISADGRYVAFESVASNLVPGDTSRNFDVFVRDRVAHTTRRISVGANRKSWQPAISADGRYVAFESLAPNLLAGDTNRTTDVFVRDRVAHTTRRVSVGPAGRQGNSYSRGAAISAHGRFVAFYSDASNLVAGDTNGFFDVFVRDRVAKVTRRVSVGPANVQANGGSGGPAISAGGRFVAFGSDASNLVSGDTNGLVDVFLSGPLR